MSARNFYCCDCNASVPIPAACSEEDARLLEKQGICDACAEPQRMPLGFHPVEDLHQNDGRTHSL